MCDLEHVKMGWESISALFAGCIALRLNLTAETAEFTEKYTQRALRTRKDIL